MSIPKFKNINIKAYKPGKSGINKNIKYVKLSANESSLGVSEGVKKIFKTKILLFIDIQTVNPKLYEKQYAKK